MKLLETILHEIEDVKVIDASIDYKKYVHLDLSNKNESLRDLKIDNATDFENYIEDYLQQNNAKVAYGGYYEIRNLYKRSTIFNDYNSDERNIHIGLDLWIKAGTPVLAAIDGFIHSYNNNFGVGDYGPTIILQHQIKDQIFYTLYGHLSLESIASIAVGKKVKKGEQIATLGDAKVNGDYAPHLHFQIISEMPTIFGDYPGVCSKKDQEFYLQNCPDPNMLLKIK